MRRSIRALGVTFRLVVAGGVLGAALFGHASAASADLQICGPGSGAGQCSNPSGVALDSSAERLYVADRGNARIDVFTLAGAFIKAFGWGVTDGDAELQSCVASCLAGVKGGGAGEFSSPEKIAVDPSSHDVYVFDSFRVQRFSSEGEFLGAWGGGVITGGAAGTGDLSAGSKTISNVKTTSWAFAAGQVISGAGIPAGTKIAMIGPGTITLSKEASASGTGVALSVAEGAGNVKVNEVQELFFGSPGVEYSLRFATPNPSPSSAETPFLKASASSAAVIKTALENLSNIDPGDVEVTGPVKDEKGRDTYKIEFKGRFEDTDVALLDGVSFGGGGAPKRTLVNGASSALEFCTPANAEDCSTGVREKGEGQFGQGNEPISVGPSSAVYVGDSLQSEPAEPGQGFENRVQKFEPSGSVVEVLALPESSGRVSALAVAPSDAFYVATNAVRKYDSGGTLLESFHPSTEINALALDGAGDLFVGDSTNPLEGTGIYEYDPTSLPLRTFYGNGTLLSRPLSLAPYSSATGDIFAAEGGASGRVMHIAFPPPGPIIHHALKLTEAAPVGNTTATLRTRINPEGKATSFHFEYVDDATYQISGFGEAVESPAQILSGAADFELHQAVAEIGCPDPESEAGNPGSKCLIPETTYHFRAVASNVDGGPRFGPEKEFTTLAPFEIITTWSTDVGADSAKLHASVNPLQIPASGIFQYIDDAAYKADIEKGGDGFKDASETGLVDFGAGDDPVARAAQLFPLAPGTTYHYRIVVTNFSTTESGPEHSFTTFSSTLPAKIDCANQPFREGAAASLPDCRAYEIVSPLDKNNGDVVAIGGTDTSALARIDQATPGGEKITYAAYRAFADPQSAPFSSQYIAERDPAAGWLSRPINAPREGPSLYSAANGADSSFKGFSEDLCSSWFLQDTENALVEGAPEGIPNLYRRQNCGEEGYELITTESPPGFGKELEGHNSLYRPTLQGFSADNSVSVFRAPAPLTSDASKEDIYQTYLHSEGELHLVSVRAPNNNKAEVHNSSVGTASGGLGASANNFRHDSVKHAVSNDASRIFWSAEFEEGLPAHDPSAGYMGPSRLYLRINPTELQSVSASKKCTEPEKACTIEISEIVSPEAATFWAANPQGTRALFTINSGPLAGNLYEVDVDKAVAYQAGSVSLVAPKVKGLLGVSEDISRLYLVSAEDLDAGGAAEAGQPNLYLHEAGAGVTFIATLGSADGGSYSVDPYERSTRVSADGLHVVFMSTASLTGYDNNDASSPAGCGGSGGLCRADAEVFLYDANEAQLRCVSCNPSGGRPAGGRNFGAGGGPGEPPPFWVIASIPGWETQHQPSRVLSADGSRLFFESFESLVLRDTNGKQDVYEWERAQSEAECEEKGAELFSPDAGGCISLISSGVGAGDAEFLDASADGSDVFFHTSSSLLVQDYGLVDIYDARVGGGFEPPDIEQKHECEGEACQSPPAPPEDPTPSSSTFQGQGNLDEAAPSKRPCPKGKRKVRRAGKPRCVKAQKKGKKRHKPNQNRRAQR